MQTRHTSTYRSQPKDYVMQELHTNIDNYPDINHNKIFKIFKNMSIAT